MVRERGFEPLRYCYRRTGLTTEERAELAQLRKENRELRDRFDSCGAAKVELFDYIEVFYKQRRRHSTLGQISPAAFERRATQAA